MKKLLALCVGVALSVPASAFTVTISEPMTDRAYIFPTQSIDVAVQVSPQPKPEYTLVIAFNDKVVGSNQATLNLPVVEYGLGNHTLKAILYDEMAQVIAQDERNIYIIPQTNLAREREAKEQAQALYDALPWYKKIGVALRQGDNSLTIAPATSNPTASEGVVVDSVGVDSSKGVQTGNGAKVGFGGVIVPISSGARGISIPNK